MLKSLDVTAKRVVEVSRKILWVATLKRRQRWYCCDEKVGSGGVLLLSDATSMCNEKSDHYGQLALTQVVAHFEDEAAKAAEAEKAARAKNGNSKKKPAAPEPKSVLLVNAQQAELANLFTAFPGLQGIMGNTLEFQDYTIEMTQLLRQSTEDKGFCLHKELTEEKLLDLLGLIGSLYRQRRQDSRGASRGGGDPSTNGSGAFIWNAEQGIVIEPLLRTTSLRLT